MDYICDVILTYQTKYWKVKVNSNLYRTETSPIREKGKINVKYSRKFQGQTALTKHNQTK